MGGGDTLAYYTSSSPTHTLLSSLGSLENGVELAPSQPCDPCTKGEPQDQVWERGECVCKGNKSVRGVEAPVAGHGSRQAVLPKAEARARQPLDAVVERAISSGTGLPTWTGRARLAHGA